MHGLLGLPLGVHNLCSLLPVLLVLFLFGGGLASESLELELEELLEVPEDKVELPKGLSFLMEESELLLLNDVDLFPTDFLGVLLSLLVDPDISFLDRIVLLVPCPLVARLSTLLRALGSSPILVFSGVPGMKSSLLTIIRSSGTGFSCSGVGSMT